MKIILKGIAVLLGILLLCCLAIYGLVRFVNPNDYRAEIADYISESLGRKVELNGPINITFSLKPKLEVENVKIANTKWGSKPSMAEIQKALVHLDLWSLLPPKKTLEFSNIELHGSDFLSELHSTGKSNWSFGKEEKKDNSSSSFLLELFSATISNLEFAHKGSSPLDLAIEKANLKTEGSKRRVNLKGTLQGEAFSIKGTIPDVRTISRFKEAPLDLEILLGKASVKAKGPILLSQPLKKSSLKLEIDFPDLSFLRVFGSESFPPQKNISGSGQLDLVDKNYNLSNLDLKIEQSDIKGSLSFDSSFKTILAQLDSTLLIFDNINPSSNQQSESSSEKNSENKEVFSKEKLPLETLRALNLEAAVKIEKLIIGEETTFSNVNLGLKSKKGQMEITPVKALFYEGDIDAEIKFDGSLDSPTLLSNFNTSGFDYGKYLAATGADQGVSGKADGKFKLSSEGASPHLLASNLKGTVDLSSGEGVVTNNMLKIISVGIQDILAPLFGKKSNVAVHCLLSSSKIEQGVITSQHQIIDSEVITVFADGSINLGKEVMDLDFDIKANNPSIASLIPPFSLKGELASPSIIPRALDAIVDLAKTGVEIASDGVDMADKLSGLVTEGKIKEVRKGMARCEHALANKDKLWPES